MTEQDKFDWSVRGLCDGARSLDQIARMLEAEAKFLRQMFKLGWLLEHYVGKHYTDTAVIKRGGRK